ncbi:hypothetical protein AB4097_14210 [Microvirga sp. 2MCAF35]
MLSDPAPNVFLTAELIPFIRAQGASGRSLDANEGLRWNLLWRLEQARG